jgi:protein involved in temperature-dependent protein secretion
MKIGRVEEAVHHFSETVRISPHDARAHKTLGEALWLLGDKDSALKQAEILKKLDTDLSKELVGIINGKIRWLPGFPGNV